MDKLTINTIMRTTIIKKAFSLLFAFGIIMASLSVQPLAMQAIQVLQADEMAFLTAPFYGTRSTTSIFGRLKLKRSTQFGNRFSVDAHNGVRATCILSNKGVVNQADVDGNVFDYQGHAGNDFPLKYVPF